jgi:hypothetical protein
LALDISCFCLRHRLTCHCLQQSTSAIFPICLLQKAFLSSPWLSFLHLLFFVFASNFVFSSLFFLMQTVL